MPGLTSRVSVTGTMYGRDDVMPGFASRGF